MVVDRMRANRVSVDAIRVGMLRSDSTTSDRSRGYKM